jgi:acetyl-CoA carboxylase alpha subunit
MPMKHYLDFEKPILELQRKLEELRRHREAHAPGINFDEEIKQIEKKIEEERKRNSVATSSIGASSETSLHPGLHSERIYGLQ